MRHPCCGEPEPAQETGRPAGSRAREVLGLAASPVFAAMALASAVAQADPASVVCGAAGASPLTGMTAMYVAMSLFHAGPWLDRLLPGARVPRGRRRHAPPARAA